MDYHKLIKSYICYVIVGSPGQVQEPFGYDICIPTLKNVRLILENNCVSGERA